MPQRSGPESPSSGNVDDARLSVIVPVLDGAATIDDLLDDLDRAAASEGRSIHAIIADNGSIDGTIDVVRRHRHSDLLVIELVDASARRGTAFAVNEGARHAETELVMFVGADDRLSSTAIEHLCGAVSVGRAAVPRLVVDSPDCQRPYRSCAQVDGLGEVALRDGGRTVTVPFFYNGFLVLRTEDFWSLGGFDEAMLAGEDADFAIRWFLAGHEVRWVPEAACTYVLKRRARSVWRTGMTSGVATSAISRKLGPGRSIKAAPWTRVLLGSLVRAVRERDRASTYGFLFQTGRIVGRAWGAVGAPSPTHR